MPHASVWTAVHARLTAGFIAGHPEVIFVPFASTWDVPRDPDTGEDITDVEGRPAAWITVQYPNVETERLTMDAPAYHVERGQLRFVLNTPRGGEAETLEAQQWSDEIAALFRWQEFDGVVTQEADPPRLNNDADFGGFLQSSVFVLYEFQFSDEE